MACARKLFALLVHLFNFVHDFSCHGEGVQWMKKRSELKSYMEFDAEKPDLESESWICGFSSEKLHNVQKNQINIKNDQLRGAQTVKNMFEFM